MGEGEKRNWFNNNKILKDYQLRYYDNKHNCLQIVIVEFLDLASVKQNHGNCFYSY